MKTKFFLALAACSLATLNLSAADTKIDAIVTAAHRDVKNAPLIVALGVTENPKAAQPIVEASVAAMPDQAVAIVGAVLEAVPERMTEILRGAIAGQPKLAVEITSVALAMFPGQGASITKIAIEAAPENLRVAIAALGNKTTFFDSPGNSANRPASHGSFPAQPIRPNIVSPSH